MGQHIKNTMLLPWHIKITKYNFKKISNFLYYVYNYILCLPLVMMAYNYPKSIVYCWFSILLVCHISTPK